jgi:N4-gp56 family major capsid protein
MINTSLVANTIQPKYSKKLLEKAIPLLKLMDFATVEDLPAGMGNTSVRFFRPPAPDLTATGAPAALTEATAPTNYRTITMTPIDVALSQRGQVTRVSDVANTVGLIKFLEVAIDLMAEECALDLDTYTRNVIVRGTPLTTGGTTDLALGLSRRYAQSTANFAGLAAATAADGCITPLDLLDCRTQLVLQRAPTFGGDYVSVMAPQVTRDVLNSSEFREVVRQNYADKLFKAEIGKFYNIRIVEATNPFQEDETEGTFASSFNSAGTNTTGLIYTSQVLGKGAFGMVKMNALGGSPMKPQVIINDKADKTDPLNQFITAGWKAYAAAVTLNGAWGINLRTKSRYA